MANPDLDARSSENDELQSDAHSKSEPSDYQFITFTDLRDSTSRQTKKRVRQHVMQGIRRNIKNEAAKKRTKDGESFGPSQGISAAGSASTNRSSSAAVKPLQSDQGPQTAAEDSLETLMEAMGQLDLDDQGNWNYQGHGSTSAFVRGITQRLSDEPASDYCPWRNPPVQQWPNLTTTVCDNESTEHQTRDLFPLPSIDVAREMTVTALEDGCALFNFVHQPTFYAMFNRMYSIDMNQYGKDEVTFLPLLYAALAVGYLYSSSADGATIGTTNAISQGRKYFQACKELLDITECHHVWSLQALVFMIIYSQSSAKMATCHSYISAAIAASLQMGLHRSDPANLRHIEKETRKRLFWTIRTMETYIVSIMGLPRILSDADIDQEMPLEIEDKYITEASILPAPEGQVTKMTAVNAHTRLIFILAKIINEVYPAKRTVKQNMKSEAYTVQGSKIKEAELDLRTWTEHLPEVLMPCSNLVSRFKRTQRLLSLAYNHVQMFLYRPFLHYISKSRRSANLEELPYIYAAACVQTSRNVIQNMKSMEEACLLNGPYWFCSYTTFCATISLVFYKLETAQWGLKDAEYGRDVLYRLASKSPAAKKNSETLIATFARVPQRMEAREDYSISPKNSTERCIMAEESITFSQPSNGEPMPSITDMVFPGANMMKGNERLGMEYLPPTGLPDYENQQTNQQDADIQFSTLDNFQDPFFAQDSSTVDSMFSDLGYPQYLQPGRDPPTMDLNQYLIPNDNQPHDISQNVPFEPFVPIHPDIAQPFQNTDLPLPSGLYNFHSSHSATGENTQSDLEELGTDNR